MGRESRLCAYAGLCLAAVVATALLAAAIAAGAAPAPCSGQPQITDGPDGHHNTTAVDAAWLSEASGHLQAVIKVQFGNWAPDHNDYTTEVAGFAFLFRVGADVHYVRVRAPDPPQPLVYDYGTWTSGGGFAGAGPTTGEIVGGGGGTATIDVPAATGAVAGAVLTDLFVLTYDDADVANPTHWVDRAPGGVTPAGTEFGADYVVGACGSGGPGAGGSALSAVKLNAPKKRTGSGRVRVQGTVAPARAGMPVELTVAGRKTSVKRLVTGADGGFSTSITLSETTRIRAAVGGLRSQTLTVTMYSRTRITVRRPRKGGVLIKGRVTPALPGRVLLLKTTAFTPAAKTVARRGRFQFRFKHLQRGRYQAVFIPFKGRAERSTSNKGAVR